MTKIVELIISEEDKEDQDGVFAISLVEDPAIEEYWVALNKQKKELKFAKVDEDKRLLIAPALIPNKQIFRLDDDGSDYYVYFSKDTIKKCSELYMKRNHLQSATLEHETEVDGMCVVESWVKEFAIDKSVKYGFEHCPVGTWFVTMRVDNDEIWNKVKEGEILGFSIEGFFTDKLSKFAKIRKNKNCPDGFEHQMPDGSYMCGKSMGYSSEEEQLEQIKDIISEAETTYLADYPWDECIADQMAEYGNEETAKKICGAIKNRTIASSVVPKAKAILTTERKKSN
tara:strand:+ start:282 stop:1136 length:855 start_codon:yes stop_codon:yes gene_type:complete